MSDPFVGQLAVVAFNFAPRNWAFCQGQLLPISQNTALFALLGVQYGGDGRSTFALPNLQGSVATGTGTGPGFSQIYQGQIGGEASTVLTAASMPAHIHPQQGTASPGNSTSPVGAIFAETPGGRGRPGTPYYQAAPSPANYAQIAPQAIGTAGGSQAHNNMMPYLTLNWIIALTGVFPPRP